MTATFQSFESLSRSGPLGDNKLDKAHRILEIQKAAQAQRLMEEIRTFWQADLKQVEHSVTLTEQGKREKAKRVSESAVGKLEALRGQRLFTIANEKLSTVDGLIADVRGEVDKSAWTAIRQMEIRRDVLAPMKQHERQFFLLKAIADGDLEVVDACLDAPGRKLLDPDTEAELRQAVLEARCPELASTRKELAHAVDVLESELAETIAGIQKAIGTVPSLRDRLGGGLEAADVEEPEPAEVA